MNLSLARLPRWSRRRVQGIAVSVGALFEPSHIPLRKWLMAAFWICASKKAMSAHQLHRLLGISHKSTWFMIHRLREAMRDGELPGPLGGVNKVVEF